jgi:hypothetical protein
MITKVMVAAILGLLSFAATAATGLANERVTFGDSDFVIADTRGQDRRDDRDDDQDDRQDCRQDEGRVGGDKRDCKQDSRGGDDDDGDS